MRSFISQVIPPLARTINSFDLTNYSLFL